MSTASTVSNVPPKDPPTSSNIYAGTEPVTPANVIQSIRMVEARVLEIALVVSKMDIDVGHIEKSMVKRILNSIVADNK